MKSSIKYMTSILLVLFSFSCFAEIVVIVHPSNASSLDAKSIQRMFLGKSKSYSDGKKVVAINQKKKSDITKDFAKKVLKKSASQLKAYWSKLIFTGKGTPPKEVSTDAEVIELVAANPNIIGYINASSVTDKVKVAGKF